MGTSKGNIGRIMYNDPQYKEKLKKSNTLEKVEIEKKCLNCENLFTIIRTISKKGIINIPKYEKKYCSRSCANSIGGKNTKGIKKPREKKPIEIKECLYCKEKFSLKRKFCSNECLRKWKKRHLSGYELYKSVASFSFSLNNYPDEFDFDLIKKYGWYSAKNRGNNQEGVSRDHIFPILKGYKENVNPHLLSHPANCQLLQHTKNISKGQKTNMTVDLLLEKIKKWNLKYGPVA